MGFLGPQQDIGDQLNLKRTRMSAFEAEYGKFATSVGAPQIILCPLTPPLMDLRMAGAPPLSFCLSFSAFLS